MANKNVCAVLHGPGDLRLEERPIPKPGEGEVQVTIRAVGLCGSDASLYKTGRVGLFPIKHPIVLGHEPAGVVSAIGPGDSDLVVGDRVALSPQRLCGTCDACASGRFNLCPHARQLATPPTDGSLTNYIVYPAKYCFKLPSNMSWEEGAFVQPIALAVYGCQRAKVKPGHAVLICGAGPLGMVMLITAKAFGATRICVTDISDERLEFLSKNCGCITLRADEGSPRDVADRVTSSLGKAPDITLECSGSPQAVSTGIYATRPGGCILLGGIGPTEVQIPLLIAAMKEVDIKAMFRSNHVYPAAIELISSGKIDVKSLVTHIYALSDVTKAFEDMKNLVQGKIVVKCSDD